LQATLFLLFLRPNLESIVYYRQISGH